MQKREINPTEWLQAFNINHAIEVTGGERVLYLSGQTANAADGTAHPGASAINCCYPALISF